jgi:APA family basic amino acid/polyamine antiporter
VLGVIAVYLSVNFVYVHVLGPEGLARTKTPASAVMRLALGERGAKLIAAGIAISTIGFLSQSMLTAPRVYFAMAEDGLFFKKLAQLNRARVPAFAIALQGALAIIIAFTGRYEQILNYVVSSDVIFFALTAACVFAFRGTRRNPTAREGAVPGVDGSTGTFPNGRVSANSFRIPGHPLTTLFFIAACGAVAFSTIHHYPGNSLIGLAIMLSGLPVYFVWAWLRRPDR